MKTKRQRVVLGLLTVGLLVVALSALLTRPSRAASSTILVSAVYYDTYLTGEPDEAARLMNVSANPVDLTDWTLSDGEGTLTLAGTLDPGASLWVAKTAISFTLEFGFLPAYEYSDSDPAVPDLVMTGTVSLANTGDELVLRDNNQIIVDSVVWEAGDATDTGWNGAGIAPYDQGGMCQGLLDTSVKSLGSFDGFSPGSSRACGGLIQTSAGQRGVSVPLWQSVRDAPDRRRTRPVGVVARPVPRCRSVPRPGSSSRGLSTRYVCAILLLS